MNMQRTGGMTTIGILNIVLGAIGSLLSLLAMLGGGLLAAAGAAAEADGSGQGAGTMVAAGGGMIMVFSFIGLAACFTLIMGGVGVLKMKPWGRMLSMVCGGVLALMQLYTLVTSGVDLFSVALLLYGGLLVGLFCMPEWKAAFSGQSSSGTHGHQSMQSSDSMRRAA